MTSPTRFYQSLQYDSSDVLGQPIATNPCRTFLDGWKIYERQGTTALSLMLSGDSIPAALPKGLMGSLVINAVMFAVEIVGGLQSGSVSLLADAVDFAGDAANYGIPLAVLAMGLTWRARAALLKGLTMAGFGVFVFARTFWAVLSGVAPEPLTMGLIASLALIANVVVALMLYAFRDGDANMRSVWLCSRNDAIGNIAVMLAALGVFGTGLGWPDFIVAAIMAGLALSSGLSIVRLARQELQISSSKERGADVSKSPSCSLPDQVVH